VRKTIAALEVVRNGRLVWLLLSELNKSEIQGEHASSFLFVLYEQAATVDWLRIVLDGMTGDVPATVTALMERHRVPPIAASDIATYLRRALADLGIPDDAGLEVSARLAQDDLDDAIANNSPTAMTALSRRARLIVDTYVDVVAPGGNGN
jgi:hypothetical protein